MSELAIRHATDADLPEVLALLASAMARDASDARFETLYRWKHEHNAFGRSPAWVALDGDRVAGIRVFMRWEFVVDGRPMRAVRAVDTATDPAYQGRGIFTRLTLHALEEVTADGVDFVFNTPNDQSRPGYLKMGWEVVGKLPVMVRPCSVRGATRIVAARVPAERWSSDSNAGEDARDVLADSALDVLITDVAAAPARRHGLWTRLSPAFLRWRYGSEPISYRAVVGPRGIESGLVILRVRRRGPAREAVLCEVLAPGGDAAASRGLVRAALRAAGADYALRLGSGRAADGDGFVQLPRQGPVLTRRVAASAAPDYLAAWHLTIGDVELF
jgi:GNAT superfamily N-acetyltransferase